jgi:nucleoside-diphosphate-sugar epimerase
LTRSDAGAQSLNAAGAEVHRGDLEDLESLRSGAAKSDGVIHCGFVHDFSKFKEVCEIDKRAIEALGSALAGSNRLLIVSAGTGALAPGRTVTEDIDPPANSPMPRVSEQSARSVALQGVTAAVIRLPQVHNTFKQGLVTYAIAVARDKGVSAYVGDGRNRWAAAHVVDVARLYKLALEKHEAARYHAVAEEGVPFRDIAEVIGRGLKVPVVSMSPEEAAAHFGWLAPFASLDMPASSTQTQKRLGWHPTGPGLIADLEQMRYFKA